MPIDKDESSQRPTRPETHLTKCARRGCHNQRADESEFCAACHAAGLAGPRATCDELTAFPEPPPKLPFTSPPCRRCLEDFTQPFPGLEAISEPPPSEDACLCGTLLDGSEADGKCASCRARIEHLTLQSSTVREAVIKSAEIHCSQTLPGKLDAHVEVVLQHSSLQRESFSLTTKFLGHLMQVSDVPRWSLVAEQPVRVRLSPAGRILAVGHRLHDAWLSLPQRSTT